MLARWAHAGRAPGIFFGQFPTHACFLPPPHQIIWSTFSPCLRIWGSLKRSARAVQLFGRLAVLEGER